MRDFLDQPHPSGRGRLGEDEAVRWLRERGVRIVERNVRTSAGEIDLIAVDGETLCFVEIKARATDAYGPAIAAVPRAKQRRLARAAALYLARRPTDRPCRFDVVGLDLEDGRWRVRHVQDAFRVS
ncbi:MAG: YraN family protein [Acidobacteriota bacterium]